MGGVVPGDHDVVKIMLHPDLLQHLESKVSIVKFHLTMNVKGFYNLIK